MVLRAKEVPEHPVSDREALIASGLVSKAEVNALQNPHIDDVAHDVKRTACSRVTGCPARS
jgi:hypothetical protein